IAPTKQKRRAQFDKTAFKKPAFTPKRLKRAPAKLPSLPSSSQDPLQKSSQDLLLLSSQDYNSQSKAKESESKAEIVEKGQSNESDSEKDSDNKKLNITTANNYTNSI
ncbi:hypothetical protein DL98DRAFT_523384, partial [Cadophora sp. DSE1049]